MKVNFCLLGQAQGYNNMRFACLLQLVSRLIRATKRAMTNIASAPAMKAILEEKYNNSQVTLLAEA
jgi:hypothetical protein